MTNTIREFEGKNTCYIYASYGAGKKRLSKKMTIIKMTTAEAIHEVENIMDLNHDNADASDYQDAWELSKYILAALKKSNTGCIYYVDDYNGNLDLEKRYHASYKGARSQCLSECC